MQGDNRVTKSVLRMIGDEKLSEIDLYVSKILSREFSYGLDSDYLQIVLNRFISELSSEELLILRSYTGYNYKNINAILRNNWNYDEHGLLNDEIKAKFLELANELKKIIDKFPTIDMDFYAYRGVDLEVLKKFEIKSLEDLMYLKGKYMYEEGFTSTSIAKESSYFNKSFENGKICNVGIKYLIPRESSDGVLLIDDMLSFSPNQNEYLLNSGSLVKVVDVNIDLENNLGELVVVLVPKKVWDLNCDRGIPARQ